MDGPMRCSSLMLNLEKHLIIGKPKGKTHLLDLDVDGAEVILKWILKNQEVKSVGWIQLVWDTV
jgi:hypothetical protein